MVPTHEYFMKSDVKLQCIVYNIQQTPNSSRMENCTYNSRQQVVVKKGSKTNVSNHRPISLTCDACKILESIVRDHISCNILRQVVQ